MNDMKKYVLPLLMVMLGAVSCKNIDLNGASDNWYLDMKVVSISSTDAYISIKYPDSFSPEVDKLEILNRDSGKSMPYAITSSNNPLVVKMVGLNPSKSYTIYAILPEHKDNYSNRGPVAVISRNDVTIKTTSR